MSHSVYPYNGNASFIFPAQQYGEEEKYSQQIPLTTLKTNTHEKQSAMLKTKSNIIINDNDEKEFQLKYIEYKLNDLGNEIIVTEINDQLNKTSNSIHDRKKRHNIIFIPTSIIFIVFSIFIILSIMDVINTNSIEYLVNPVNATLRTSASKLDMEKLEHTDGTL
eukprot:522081_1